MEPRLSKRRVLCVGLGARQPSLSPGIWHFEAAFFWCRAHLEGSDQPAGHLDRCGLSDDEVRVRWQSDEQSDEYAARISHALDSAVAISLAAQVSRGAARVRAGHGRITREALVGELAVLVEYAAPWTYQRVLGEPAALER